MATRYAVQSGNWSSSSTWDGGTLPGAGDDVYADGKTVTIDTDVNVGSLRQTSRGAGGILGGNFNVPAGGRIVTMTGVGTVPTSTSGASQGTLQLSHTSGTVTINGNVGGGTSTPNAHAMVISASGGTINVNGNVTGCSGAANTYGILVNGTVALNIVGNVQGGMAAGASGIHHATGTGATINITGSVVAAVGAGVTSLAALTIGVVGPVTAGSNNSGLNLNASTVSIIGAITANASQAAIVATNGILTGTFVGPIRSSANAHGINSPFAGSMVTASGPFENSDYMAVLCQRVRLISSGETSWRFNNDQSGTKTLYSPGTLPGVPLVADVRSGVVYGPANDLTGSLVVPSPSNVASGVPTDNTTGTAALTPEAMWGHLLGSDAAGSAGEKLAALGAAMLVA